jgi:hypothetical protein
VLEEQAVPAELELSQISAVFQPVPWEYVPVAAELPIEEINFRSFVLELDPDRRLLEIEPEHVADVIP